MHAGNIKNPFYHYNNIMMHAGIEPAPPAWQAEILPLNQCTFNI